MAELMFLTDTIEDEQFEGNPDVLEVIAEDYTQMFELAMSRGLVIEEDEFGDQLQMDGIPGGSEHTKFIDASPGT